MDNHWQIRKCSSTWQSSVQPATEMIPSPVSQVQSHDSVRNPVISSNHYSYPHIMQERSSSTRKMLVDPFLQTSSFSLHNSNLSAMGTPFFTLLSGPPSLSQYNSQQIPSSKSSNPPSKAYVFNSNTIVGPPQREASYGSSNPPTQVINNSYLKSKVNICSVVPVRSLASDGGNTTSCLHDVVQARKLSDPTVELAKAANYHTSHGIQQSNDFSSLKAAPISGPMPAQREKLHNPSIPLQPSPLISGLPRVFCLYASGNLLLSSNGVLGVVCSCHGFRMSISNFLEHSGLRNVNPGDAVHMDSGETIAQWRKVYFSRFGIKIPEDHCGWHWPEGYSTSADLVKSREKVPDVTKISDLSKTVGFRKSFAASVHPSTNIIFPVDHSSCSSFLSEIRSHSNANSGAVNKTMQQSVTHSFQSGPTYVDPNYKTNNMFSCQQDLQSIRSIGRDSEKYNNSSGGDKRGKTKVSSNIELRLGQPAQQSKLFGKSNLSGFSGHVGRVSHPTELVSSQLLNYNGTKKVLEEAKQIVNCAAKAAISSSIEGQNRLGFSNLGFGAYSTRTEFQPEKLKGDAVVGSVNSILFSNLENPKDKMPKQQYGESQISKLGSVNFECNMERFKLLDKEKQSEHVDNVYSRPVTWQPVSPRPTLIPGAQSTVFSSTVMNSHVHSLRPDVTRANQNDQTLPGNQISENSNPIIHPLKSFTRVDMGEDICSSSGHRHCCQGTSCAYNVPNKCNCWLQRNIMIKKFNLEENKFVSAFGEPSQIRPSVLSPSKMEKDKDRTTLHDKSNSLVEIIETPKSNLKKVEFNTFQWKDVPNKIPRTCHVPCTDQPADVTEQISDVIVKCVDQPGQKVDSLKEQVLSNISSKCSAPALTQASVKISNGDSCTDDAQNTDCAKNFAVDAASGIQKNWSSDDDDDGDEHDSSSNNGFDIKNKSVNDKRSKVVSDQSGRNLVDEIRVIDSLRLKKVQSQVHTKLHSHRNGTSLKPFEKEFESRKRKKEKKFKILGKSFLASPVSSVSTGSSSHSSQFLDDVHKNDKNRKKLSCKTLKRVRVHDDFREIPESSRGKKIRMETNVSEMHCKKISKPIVCGKYGLISNGDTSKPAKIFSLGKILKTAKKCSTDGRKLVKKRHIKASKKAIIRVGNRHSDRLSNLKKDKYCIGTSVFSDGDPMEASNSGLGNRKRRKGKEIRIRSIYDLIKEGKDSGFAENFKKIKSIPQDNLKNGGYSNDVHEVHNISRCLKEVASKSTIDLDTHCDVCGSFNNDEVNCLLECNRCLIKVHQACYGISKVPKGFWHCRPCRENATNMVCVLCGYEGGVMTRAVQSSNIVRSLLNAWNVVTESHENQVDIVTPKNTICVHIRATSVPDQAVKNPSNPVKGKMVTNSVIAGFFNSSVKQWVHMVCGLWTPGTRCPNVNTMSAFDVSNAHSPKGTVVCSMCKRAGGCCIRCRVINCAVHFHPWCAHQKGLLQSVIEGVDNDKIGFYGRCELHATENHFNQKTTTQSIQVASPDEKETCARTEGYKGRKREGFRHDSRHNASSTGGYVVQQEQLDAWNHINRQLLYKRRFQRTPQLVQDVEYDVRKEYARYKQSKNWKQLVVYKSGIHALGLYTSNFISQSAMVVEYVGEIVGLRVADRRELEYQSGKQLQYKSACYFFKIDKEHIIDATRKGGVARFVNHSCQPNCVAKVITIRGEKKVVFFAVRDIYPGEEITYDYHFNNEDEGKKILCSCNSNNCRRYLN
ncbi:uncharacterized protein [Rutidosis leptorrhynchoides]|uniref:uncharacterized protein isoform X2 n=1 Tax=Rutidosis leptorrhynchoides TaxID=125765 RepID=UPI003A995BDF